MTSVEGKLISQKSLYVMFVYSLPVHCLNDFVSSRLTSCECNPETESSFLCDSCYSFDCLLLICVLPAEGYELIRDHEDLINSQTEMLRLQHYSSQTKRRHVMTLVYQIINFSLVCILFLVCCPSILGLLLQMRAKKIKKKNKSK